MNRALSLLISFLLLLPLSARLKADSSSQTPAPREQWKGIYVDDQKIGYSHSTHQRRGSRWEIEEETNFKMVTLGVTQDISIDSRYVLDGYTLQSFDFQMSTGELDLAATGKREGDVMEIEVQSISGKSTLAYEIADDTLVLPALDRWLLEKGAAPGDEFRVRVFEPTSVLTGTPPERMVARISVKNAERVSTPLGESDALKVEVTLNGSTSTAWIDESGQTVKEIAEPGLLTLLETKEEALGRAASGIDVVAKTAVSSNVELSNPARLSYMRLRLQGIPSLEGLDLNDRGRQTLRDGTLEIRLESLDRVKPYHLPYRGGELEHYLEPTALIQSDHPEIKETAERVLDGESDSLLAAKRLVRWTHSSLDKAPTVSIPSALDVLKTRRGDCNEHAALFAGLARAAGIPTKIAMGLVYIGGKFYYHAWNEVYIGEWVAADSTFGQFPADASHIKLVEGGIDRGSEILKLVGKLKVEIIEAS